MLVYGDPQFTTRFQTVRGRLCVLAGRVSELPHDIDRLRHLLIACGQVEQGLHDALPAGLPAGEAQRHGAAMHQATAHAAAAFYSRAYRQALALPQPVVGMAAALEGLQQSLDRLRNAPDLTVTVKLPEGFSFHALYPEQYLLAAGQWLADHQAQRAQSATVVGIRSIGTTLAAVVGSVLRADGWQVHSFTVRPSGQPFAREVQLECMAPRPDSLGLIVDEGPGISGSSMAATAEALVGAGLQRHRISFLPGHANGPGGAGDADVGQWWQTAPCYVGDAGTLAVDDRPLHQALAATLAEPVHDVENFSGGLWRRHLYADPSAWPATCTHFERVKYRYTSAGGRRVLAKFLGLATRSPDLESTSAAAATLLDQRHRQGHAPPVVAQAHGFVVTEWIEGTVVDLATAPSNMADTLGAYIAHVTGAPLADDEARASRKRLNEMLCANTREALGEDAASRAHELCRATEDRHRAYGDGHLLPHEWIQCEPNKLLKVDGVGHDCDHTVVGKQPVAWDLAGAMVEWRLDPQAIGRLLAAYSAAGGAPVSHDVLHFYRAAYLAFRAGQCALAAQVHDPYERDRLLLAYDDYRRQLADLLRMAVFHRMPAE
jgi:hypothetical protein